MTATVDETVKSPATAGDADAIVAAASLLPLPSVSDAGVRGIINDGFGAGEPVASCMGSEQEVAKNVQTVFDCWEQGERMYEHGYRSNSVFTSVLDAALSEEERQFAEPLGKGAGNIYEELVLSVDGYGKLGTAGADEGPGALACISRFIDSSKQCFLDITTWSASYE